jgi:hypothetical protein
MIAAVNQMQPLCRQCPGESTYGADLSEAASDWLGGQPKDRADPAIERLRRIKIPCVKERNLRGDSTLILLSRSFAKI